MVLLECKDNTWKVRLSIDEGDFLRASGSQYIDGAIDAIKIVVLVVFPFFGGVVFLRVGNP